MQVIKDVFIAVLHPLCITGYIPTKLTDESICSRKTYSDLPAESANSFLFLAEYIKHDRSRRGVQGINAI